MSIISELNHLLGVIKGIVIKGQSPAIVNVTHAVEQSVADAFGPAAVAMAKTLNGSSYSTLAGRDKLFAIDDAIVSTAVQNGFKGDVAILKTAGLNVALSAYKAAEPNFGADIVALATHLSNNPIVGVAAEFAGSVIQAAADKTMPQPAPAETQLAA